MNRTGGVGGAPLGFPCIGRFDCGRGRHCHVARREHTHATLGATS
jgi:hypothetical protein